MPKPNPLPSRAELLENFTYEPKTGLLYWRKRGPGRRPDGIAGTESYQRRGGPPAGIDVGFKGKLYKAHRIAWLIMTGDDPGHLTIDHINRRPFDNKWENLRLADYSLQSLNKGNWGISGYKGVSFHKGKGKWVAQVRRNGKTRHLGYFATEEEAAAVAAPYFIH